MLEPLPGPEIRKLKAAAQRLKATVHVGKAGLSPRFIAAVGQELARHELIKLKFDNFKEERKALSRRIAEETSSHLVWMVGHVAVFYRKRPAESCSSTPSVRSQRSWTSPD
jgi:RNA-binding protein